MQLHCICGKHISREFLLNVDPELIDRFYEASVIPELWPNVCTQLSNAVDSYSFIVFNVAPDLTYSFVSSPSVKDQMGEFVKSALRFQNIRPIRALERAPSTFVRDIELMTEDEIDNDPVNIHFIRPKGLKWMLGCAIQEPSGHVLAFDAMRRIEQPHFSEKDVMLLNHYKPDLARAALLTSRLAFKQAQTITQTLSAVGLPAAVIGDAGNVVAVNAEMDALEPRIRTGMKDRISLGSPSANKLFQEILEQLKLGIAPQVQSLAVPADEENPPMVLHLLPVKRNARDIFSRSMSILIATTIGQSGPPDLRVICGLFDLTLAEARVAREIAIGASVEDIATKLGLKKATIRTHIKVIFSKTGTSRQFQLTALLSGLGTAHNQDR
jgi:DNA-binding CsgD family transcriptional regulator